MTKIYNKLVRDRIPEIIEADGKVCTTEILPDDRYLRMLDAKLDEELAEYQESKSLEELADLLEVVTLGQKNEKALCYETGSAKGLGRYKISRHPSQAKNLSTHSKP